MRTNDTAARRERKLIHSAIASMGLIVMVAALNIVASLVLLVMEKTRDIAILKTMGALIAWLLDRYQVISIRSDLDYVTYLPFKLQPFDVLTVAVAAVVAPGHALPVEAGRPAGSGAGLALRVAPCPSWWRTTSPKAADPAAGRRLRLRCFAMRAPGRVQLDDEVHGVRAPSETRRDRTSPSRSGRC